MVNSNQRKWNDESEKEEQQEKSQNNKEEKVQKETEKEKPKETDLNIGESNLKEDITHNGVSNDIEANDNSTSNDSEVLIDIKNADVFNREFIDDNNQTEIRFSLANSEFLENKQRARSEKITEKESFAFLNNNDHFFKTLGDDCYSELQSSFKKRGESESFRVPSPLQDPPKRQLFTNMQTQSYRPKMSQSNMLINAQLKHFRESKTQDRHCRDQFISPNAYMYPQRKNQNSLPMSCINEAQKNTMMNSSLLKKNSNSLKQKNLQYRLNQKKLKNSDPSSLLGFTPSSQKINNYFDFKTVTDKHNSKRLDSKSDLSYVKNNEDEFYQIIGLGFKEFIKDDCPTEKPFKKKLVESKKRGRKEVQKSNSRFKKFSNNNAKLSTPEQRKTYFDSNLNEQLLTSDKKVLKRTHKSEKDNQNLLSSQLKPKLKRKTRKSMTKEEEKVKQTDIQQLEKVTNLLDNNSLTEFDKKIMNTMIKSFKRQKLGHTGRRFYFSKKNNDNISTNSEKESSKKASNVKLNAKNLIQEFLNFSEDDSDILRIDKKHKKQYLN
jgi:hypothetical protein